MLKSLCGHLNTFPQNPLNSQLASITQTTKPPHRGSISAKTGASLIKDHLEPELRPTGVLIRNKDLREETRGAKKCLFGIIQTLGTAESQKQ